MKPLTFDEYQKRAVATLLTTDDKLTDVIHMILGISGEAGEVSERLKKLIRDQKGDLAKLDLNDLKKEIGDVLWYLAVLAELLGISFEDLAQANLEKLASRQARGTLRGSGDNR